MHAPVLYQKRKERIKTMKLLLHTDDERIKWMTVMEDDFMSTEESCEDDNTAFTIRPLTWRSLEVNDFFGRLDTAAKNRRSSQSRKMRYERHTGEPSQRPCPVSKYGKSLLWAFSRAYHPAPSPSSSATPSLGT